MGHYQDCYDSEREKRNRAEEVKRGRLAGQIYTLLSEARQYPAAAQKLKEAYLELLYGHNII